ncbi:hypothetical protein GCM10009630_46060 [Kribbella jejuensis]|uniref:Methylmalonyl-CoA mutase n=1 Tax=Kribbella jejuensis TaxID=236068 RepID=A0A542EWU4_9ACTN|nr:methylmalonyl-CoA mutase [Kribbella jejuensis]
MEYRATTIPTYQPLSVSEYHLRDASPTTALELACTLTDGLRRPRHPPTMPLRVSEYHPRDAGSTAAQELGYTPGDGLGRAHVPHATKRSACELPCAPGAFQYRSGNAGGVRTDGPVGWLRRGCLL